MLKVHELHGKSDEPMLTTDELAAEMKLEPQTLLKHHSKNGSYYGLRPLKLPNRHLRWSSNWLELIKKGAA